MVKYIIIIMSCLLIYQMLFLHFVILRKPKNGSSEIRKFKSTKVINGKEIKIKKTTKNQIMLGAYTLLIVNVFYLIFLLANAIMDHQSYNQVIIGWDYILPALIIIYSLLLVAIYHQLKSKTIKQFFKDYKWLIFFFLISEIALMTYSSLVLIYLFS